MNKKQKYNVMDNEEIKENTPNSNCLLISRYEGMKEQINRKQQYLLDELTQLENDFNELEFAEEQESSHSVPTLIVKSGEIKKISQRTRSYEKVVIESGGILEITGRSRQWSILNVTNEFICNGKIICTGIPYGNSPILATAPDGTSLSHSYPSLARGGMGGSGGFAYSDTRNSRGRRAEGGKGARGNKRDGGGGGGGADALFCQICRDSEVVPGDDAIDYIGGLGGRNRNTKGGDGGDGGRGSLNRNGGLLYIRAKIFDGTGGKIILNGQNGLPGSSGGRGGVDNYSGSSKGSGGGGGGSPGGDGGVLFVHYNNLIQEAYVDTSPGRGGRGGDTNTHGNDGVRGRSGDDGEGGYADWIEF